MKIITGLSGSQGHSKSMSLFLDDKFAFKLEAEIVLKEGLRVGQELSLEQIEALKKNNQYQKCRDTALKYLDYRP
ncbi:MAG: regulatory protein RecX, partial [Dehalococcoidales bacterium]|nr:regulatory protein RecX [Dehalococcoidales bacterium]